MFINKEILIKMLSLHFQKLIMLINSPLKIVGEVRIVNRMWLVMNFIVIIMIEIAIGLSI